MLEVPAMFTKWMSEMLSVLRKCAHVALVDADQVVDVLDMRVMVSHIRLKMCITKFPDRKEEKREISSEV